MKVALKNDFHGSETSVYVSAGDYLTRARVRAIRRRLCPYPDCTCGDFLGRRGAQGGPKLVIAENADGSACVFEF